MPIIKDFIRAKKKIIKFSERFDLSKCKKEYETVEAIIENVRKKGDKALIYYTKKFDKVDLKSFQVSRTLINSSSKKISKELLTAIKKAKNRIKKFHEVNIPQSWIKSFQPGEKLGYKYEPIESIGIYIPGGGIPLLSTVLMTVIPAKVIGVKRIVIFTPPPVHAEILSTCQLCGIKEIYQIGGAQAIAAAAYGTKSIKPVSKIIGPGNIYVTLAKKILFGKVGIDGLFGPSEIAIIADQFANPSFLAMDLLSQLEHGSGNESTLLVTNSKKIARETQKILLKNAKKLPNAKIVLKSWRNNSAIVMVKNLNQGVELINLFAPEHLEIITKNPNVHLKKIKNAGAIFLGEYSCESIGDYIAGPSHCLPTGSTARFASGLTIMDFLKKSSIIFFNKNAFNKVAKDVIELANAEKLPAHSDAVRIRI